MDDDFDEEDDGFSTPADEVDSSMDEEENLNNLTIQEEELASFLSDATGTTRNNQHGDTRDEAVLIREEHVEASNSRLLDYDKIIHLSSQDKSL